MKYIVSNETYFCIVLNLHIFGFLGVVERSWGESNGHVTLPVYDLTDIMKQSNILDLNDPYHIGAMQQLLPPLVQHGLDMLRSRWNRHFVRGTKRRPGGVPNQLALLYPHPGGQSQLQLGVDMSARYDASRRGGSRATGSMGSAPGSSSGGQRCRPSGAVSGWHGVTL